MTDTEIVRKMIEKALSNGWKELDTINLHPEQKCFGLGYNEIIAVLFNPQFAKCLWGEERICAECGAKGFGHCGHEYGIKSYRYHQHKLLDEIQAGRNPLKYIETYLEERKCH